MSEPLLQVEGLETTFFTKAGALKALDGVSYTINRGEVLGIVGESGCGKSVTSYSLMGLLDHPGKVTGGRALLNGVDLLALNEEEYQKVRAKKIAMIFQEPMTALNPVLTIGQQIDEQLFQHTDLTPAQARKHSIEMLAKVGIPSPEERYSNYPHQLSGGMRQRAMIAMALALGPEFLIADEPTTALDVTIQAQILELFQSLQKEMGMTVQFITHDLGVISEISDRVMVMYAGRSAELAPTEELFRSPRHPYTASLVRSIPVLGQRLERLPTIEGVVPSLMERPAGCAFQNRCPFQTPECSQGVPPFTELSPGHFVACFHPLEAK